MPRQPLQIWRQATNRFHGTTGLCHQRFRPASRLGDPHHEGISALGQRHVLPRGLSELVARGGDVENIIRNLERQAERIPEVGKRGQEMVIGTGGQGTNSCRRGNQRPGLCPVNLFQFGETQSLTFRKEVEQLPADHPTSAGRRHELSNDLPGERRTVAKFHRGVVRAPRGQRHHGNPSRGGRGNIERAMYRRSPAANVVVVHARQVVVHERIGVHHFDCRSQTAGVARASRGAVRRQDQQSAESLAVAEQAVPDRFRNARRNAHQVLSATRREGGLDQFSVANGQPDR